MIEPDAVVALGLGARHLEPPQRRRGCVREAQVEREPVGSYETTKRFDNGLEVPCVIHIYPAEVTRLSEDFPESDRREVLWTSLDDAIARADDPGIAEVLTTFRERFA